MRRLLLVSTLVLAACSEEPAPQPPFKELPGTQVVFDPAADLGRQRAFYDLPFPLDARLGPDGLPDLRGFPNRQSNETVEQLRRTSATHPYTPVLPVAYFRFGAALAPRDPSEVIPAAPSSPLLLVDVDPGSPERGRLFPVVAHTIPADDYVPQHFLALAPRPGFVLAPKRAYAAVVMRSALDAQGQPLGMPASLAKLLNGEQPQGERGEALLKAYAPLKDGLLAAKVTLSEVAAATVFTTGDVVADLEALSSRLVQKHDVTLTGLALDADDGGSHERFCEVQGRVKYPQFQAGKPPFDTDGLFAAGADGLPEVQREEEALIVLTLPKAPMPAEGYPLLLYFHGSGGLHDQVVDRGRWDPKTEKNEKGKGPAHILSPYGIATAGSALPVNPERLQGAGEQAYLNLKNPPAFR
ncbi:MAG: hypothetical protein ACK4N5_09205, partial [Myxococcales bacterium]